MVSVQVPPGIESDGNAVETVLRITAGTNEDESGARCLGVHPKGWGMGSVVGTESTNVGFE
jgi:hypothetical protein